VPKHFGHSGIALSSVIAALDVLGTAVNLWFRTLSWGISGLAGMAGVEDYTTRKTEHKLRLHRTF
jgi:hypothetical protein